MHSAALRQEKHQKVTKEAAFEHSVIFAMYF